MRYEITNDLPQYNRLVQPDSRELAGSHNMYNFTAFTLDRQDLRIDRQLPVDRAAINFRQFVVAISASDCLHDMTFTC